ncbi:MFS transporter, CP family, cyanate transporter [Seinonella peptonophila]|uniref:MFS transporter, CP family, cyanate transporter n=1 Tax=Seinonella peptonophila TaxID=112248 RepID=A0A1M4VHU9_9BACL|nr:MFS transporter [Seinonella peptonophila]SHE68549.1 MFS transporter, CP family, cyanate transporter [Seinonella peptonophila]
MNQNTEATSVKPLHSVPFLLLIGIFFVAANMRTSITSIGPLINDIRVELGLSNTWVGLLTTLPLFAFALISPLAPRWSRDIGTSKTIFYSLFVLLAGILIRPFGIGGLLFGTFIIGVAVAVFNVLMPSLVKERFPERIGLATGFYTVSMTSFAALAIGLSLPLAENLGSWKWSLVLWGVLAVCAMFAWRPQLKGMQKTVQIKQQKISRATMWKSPIVWAVTLFMGLQSFGFYVFITWGPEFLLSIGIPRTEAGWLMSIGQILGLPAYFAIPFFVDRSKDQRLITLMACLITIGGYIGLLSGSSSLIMIWLTLLNLGQSATLGLTFILFAKRTHNAVQAAQISGMAQSIGYLIAAIGPLLIGGIHDLTHTWTTPFLVLIGSALFMTVTGYLGSRDRYIESSFE